MIRLEQQLEKAVQAKAIVDQIAADLHRALDEERDLFGEVDGDADDGDLAQVIDLEGDDHDLDDADIAELVAVDADDDDLDDIDIGDRSIEEVADENAAREERHPTRSAA